jgi:hypothetical protein
MRSELAFEHLNDIRFKMAGIEQISNPDQTLGCDSDKKENGSDSAKHGLVLFCTRIGRMQITFALPGAIFY